MAGLRRDVLNQVSEGMALVWESYKLDPYVQKLSEVVLLFQEKVSCISNIKSSIISKTLTKTIICYDLKEGDMFILL